MRPHSERQLKEFEQFHACLEEGFLPMYLVAGEDRAVFGYGVRFLESIGMDVMALGDLGLDCLYEAANKWLDFLSNPSAFKHVITCVLGFSEKDAFTVHAVGVDEKEAVAICPGVLRCSGVITMAELFNNGNGLVLVNATKQGS